ncbi:hypothetical protein [Streptomyces sp. NRRL WC-3742]|uniref:WXG100-like domain-containing protein n=1 Tax=Streptomyces sp. NRRL WC-3742 TaxID=1463934 RepID=UPI0004C60B72|nr:hypothetical protein [Streptomyces sp. NRRL WC-3742]
MSKSSVARAVQKVTGMWWPDADPGKLRKVADAWDAMATALDNVTVPTNKAAAAIVANNHGPAIDAFGKFWGRYYGGKDKGWLPETAAACRALAKALREFAEAVDKAIEKLEEEAALVAGTLLVGTALALVTLSLSEGAALAASAAIVATAASVGVTVSETVALIAATVLVGATFGGLEAITVDIAVAQPIRVELFGDGGYSLDEVNEAAKSGEILGAAGGALGAGGRVAIRAADSAEAAAPLALSGLAKAATAAETLPGRMAVGAGLTYAYDTTFQTGPVMPLDLIAAAAGAGAAPRRPAGRSKVAMPEEPQPLGGVHPGTTGANPAPDRVASAAAAVPEGDLRAEYLARSDPDALPKYEKIRAMTDDVARIADNLEIDESIVAKAKEHLFLTKHKVQFGPGDKVVEGEYFNAHEEIADYWLRSRNWNATDMTKGIVKGIIAHEYVESILMAAGVPYRTAVESAWADPYDLHPSNVGAHELAPESMSGFPLTLEGTLKHWQKLGITPPDVPIADNLSNLDLLAQSALEWWHANRQESH